MKRWLLFIPALLLIVLARCWNASQIFVEGQIYFVDADCYSRMTRVALVLANSGAILRNHVFENWPIGTTPHTTALFDYLIAILAWITGKIDLAGALMPLLIAVGSGILLWKWVGQFRWLTQCAVLCTFAVSPILVHGTVLGRPDHQSLLILLLLAAFIAEWQIQNGSTSRRNAIFHGLAWGLAIWTSLFEPAILLLANVVFGIAVFRGKWLTPTRKISFLVTGGVLLIALSIEHWHTGPLPTGPLFARWSKSIGELAAVGWISKTYLGWFGLAILWLPFALFWQNFRDKNKTALYWGLLLMLTYVLTTTAARWGYFMGIAFLFALPVVLEKWRGGWITAIFFLGLWPIASEWDARLWPETAERERLAEQREDYRQLRQICGSIHGGGIIAPWWLSPPIAYWSGANCVAGSSHQSLPGNEDVARFYLSRFPENAREILRRRQVTWVVAYEPSRVLSTSSSLVDEPAAGDAFAATLYNSPRRIPKFLQLEKETAFFKLYRTTDQL